MSTDLLTCKQIHQHLSMLVREAVGRLTGGSGGAELPQDKITCYQSCISNAFFYISYIFIYFLIFAISAVWGLAGVIL